MLGAIENIDPTPGQYITSYLILGFYDDMTLRCILYNAHMTFVIATNHFAEHLKLPADNRRRYCALENKSPPSARRVRINLRLGRSESHLPFSHNGN
jgi:hypothetical protein